MHFINAKGNVLLDMVLVTPLALLLLFVGIDGGLTYIERSAVYDAVRVGLNAEAIISKKFQVYQYGADGEFAVDSSELREIGNTVALAILSNLSNAKNIKGDDGVALVRVEVSAVMFEVNPETGRIVSGADIEILSTSTLPNAGMSSELTNSDYSYLSREDFIAAQIRQEGSQIASRFAVPLGVSYDASSAEQSSERYLEKTVILYAEVRSVRSGINNSIVKKTLGRFYATQEQQLRALRGQL